VINGHTQLNFMYFFLFDFQLFIRFQVKLTLMLSLPFKKIKIMLSLNINKIDFLGPFHLMMYVGTIYIIK